MTRWRDSGLLALAGSAAAGVALALGQVPVSAWPVAFAGLLAGLWIVARAGTVRQAALRGLLFGAGHFAVSLHWITHPFQVDAARDGWMAPFALVFLSFGLALFWALAAALAIRITAAGPARFLALAAALASAEALRGHVLTGFPWALIGHVWIGWAPEQTVALIGAYGLTALTLLAAALPLALRRRGVGAVASLVLLAALAGHGTWRAGLPVPESPGPVVRLVQPDAAQHLKWDPQMAREFFHRQLDYTSAAAPRRPDLVIWPETAVPFLLDQPFDGLERVAEAAAGVPVALGIQRLDGWRGYNSLALLGPDAEVRAVYDKHHLVPFGEYMPFGDLMADLFGITAFAAQEGKGYSAGPGPGLMDFGVLGLAAPLICYEAVFPWILRALPQRPGWILQVTNDSWFGKLSGPWQHLSLARLRAIEQGLPVARAANTGVSAMIDARGRVTAALGLGVAGFIDAPLPAALPPPPYARWGEVPALVLIALLWAAALLSRRIGIDAARRAD